LKEKEGGKIRFFDQALLKFLVKHHSLFSFDETTARLNKPIRKSGLKIPKSSSPKIPFSCKYKVNSG
jgi:hypothetical protein